MQIFPILIDVCSCCRCFWAVVALIYSSLKKSNSTWLAKPNKLPVWEKFPKKWEAVSAVVKSDRYLNVFLLSPDFGWNEKRRLFKVEVVDGEKENNREAPFKRRRRSTLALVLPVYLVFLTWFFVAGCKFVKFGLNFLLS